jgi:hypothetical protein
MDHYALFSDADLLEASLAPEGPNDVLKKIRAVEAADPSCEKYPRFKPADDATAVTLKDYP